MNLSIPDYILGIRPYSPGKPIEELKREIRTPYTVKLASNENPLGPSPLAVKAVREALGNIHRYPDSLGHDLVHKLSERMGMDAKHIVLGNGSDDLIDILTRALLQHGDEVIAAKPSFLMYDIMVRSAGAKLVEVPLLEDLSIDLEGFEKSITSKTRLMFVCNPNNPTGTVVTKSAFESFLTKVPSNIVVVMDEAYAEFVRDENAANGLDYFSPKRPLVILRTFSKAYGLAGLRLGYGVMPEALSDVLHRVRPPFNVNMLAQKAALAALDDHEFLEKTIRLTHEGLDFLYESLDKLGVRYFPTQTNFFLFDVRKDADSVFQALLTQGVIVRAMTAYDYPSYIRVNVGLPEENKIFIDALAKVLS